MRTSILFFLVLAAMDSNGQASGPIFSCNPSNTGFFVSTAFPGGYSVCSTHFWVEPGLPLPSSSEVIGFAFGGGGARSSIESEILNNLLLNNSEESLGPWELANSTPATIRPNGFTAWVQNTYEARILNNGNPTNFFRRYNERSVVCRPGSVLGGWQQFSSWYVGSAVLHPHLCQGCVGADCDGDGVRDSGTNDIGDADNCLGTPNPGQEDSDADGIGDSCDGDFNNDCSVNFIDLGFFRKAFFTDSPQHDLNSDGVVNAVDLGIFRTLFFASVGPSGQEDICD